jgi:hypothetical protein
VSTFRTLFPHTAQLAVIHANLVAPDCGLNRVKPSAQLPAFVIFTFRALQKGLDGFLLTQMPDGRAYAFEEK